MDDLAGGWGAPGWGEFLYKGKKAVNPPSKRKTSAPPRGWKYIIPPGFRFTIFPSFQNFTKYFKILENISKCYKVFQNFRKGFKILQNISKFYKSSLEF